MAEHALARARKNKSATVGDGSLYPPVRSRRTDARNGTGRYVFRMRFVMRRDENVTATVLHFQRRGLRRSVTPAVALRQSRSVVNFYRGSTSDRSISSIASVSPARLQNLKEKEEKEKSGILFERLTATLR